MKTNYLILAATLFIAFELNAQPGITISHRSLQIVNTERQFSAGQLESDVSNSILKTALFAINDNAGPVHRGTVPPAIMSIKHYGVFCRLEDESTHHRKFAPRFRLGSYDYVNSLEGK